jgi:hypothetical protein
MKPDLYIGIDPDLTKCGVAFWRPTLKSLDLELMSVPAIIRHLDIIRKGDLTFEVIIEAGWLNKKSNFRTTQNKAVGESIARNVGENSASGKIVAQACAELDIPHKLIRPTKSKVTWQFFEQLTGIKTKNQELIDAGMLVYGM